MTTPGNKPTESLVPDESSGRSKNSGRRRDRFGLGTALSKIRRFGSSRSPVPDRPASPLHPSAASSTGDSSTTESRANSVRGRKRLLDRVFPSRTPSPMPDAAAQVPRPPVVSDVPTPSTIGRDTSSGPANLGVGVEASIAIQPGVGPIEGPLVEDFPLLASSPNSQALPSSALVTIVTDDDPLSAGGPVGIQTAPVEAADRPRSDDQSHGQLFSPPTPSPARRVSASPPNPAVGPMGADSANNRHKTVGIDAGLGRSKDSGDEATEKPPAARKKASGAGTVALHAFDTALRVLSKVSSAFPPLQAPVEGLIACIDIFKVSVQIYNFKQC